MNACGEDEAIFRQRAAAAGMRVPLIDRWLQGSNEAFAGDTPDNALVEGRLLEVVEAAEEFAAGRCSSRPRCTCASHGLAAEYRHGLGCPYGRHLRAEAHADWANPSADSTRETSE